MLLPVLKTHVCLNLGFMLLSRYITVDTQLAVSWYWKEKNHSHLNADGLVSIKRNRWVGREKIRRGEIMSLPVSS